MNANSVNGTWEIFRTGSQKCGQFLFQTTDETDSAKSASCNFSLSTVTWFFMLIEIANLKDAVITPYGLY